MYLVGTALSLARLPFLLQRSTARNREREREKERERCGVCVMKGLRNREKKETNEGEQEREERVEMTMPNVQPLSKSAAKGGSMISDG